MNNLKALLEKKLAARHSAATQAPVAVSAPAAVVPPSTVTTSALPVLHKPAAMTPAKPAALKKSPADYPAEERALRDEKMLYIRMCLDHQAASRCTLPLAAAEIARRHPQLFPLLSAKGGLRYHNLRNWINGSHGKPGLRNPATGKIDWSRGDLLLRNYGPNQLQRFGDERFWTALCAAFMNNNQGKLSKIYRSLTAEWLSNFPGIELPSLGQVRYYITQRYPRRLKALARDGETSYQQQFRDYIERDPDTIQPNEAWVADTQECDFMIRTAMPDGSFQAVRPWICVIVDIKSEHVVSCQLGVDAVNSTVIRNALAAAIYFYGRPQKFLTDNGSDYCKVGFTSPVTFRRGQETYEHCVLKELAIEHRRAEVYNARVKYVERFFREMAEYARHARGYVGNCPANRPATAEVWSRPENCAHLMNAFEATEFLNRAIDAYHDKPAPKSKYLKGLSPRQAFAPGMRVERPAMSYEELYRALLMPLEQSRIVDARGPSVQVDKLRYVAAPQDRAKLWMHDGKPVMVKFDILSREYCYIYDLDGTYLAQACRPELIPYFAEGADRDRLAVKLAEIRGEEKALQTMLWHETKGFHRLDPETILSLPPDAFRDRARLHLIDRRTSVKGETHNPAIYTTPAQAALVPAAPAPADREIKRITAPKGRKHGNLQLQEDTERRLLSADLPPARGTIDLSDLSQTPNQPQKKEALHEDFY